MKMDGERNTQTKQTTKQHSWQQQRLPTDRAGENREELAHLGSLPDCPSISPSSASGR